MVDVKFVVVAAAVVVVTLLLRTPWSFGLVLFCQSRRQTGVAAGVTHIGRRFSFPVVLAGLSLQRTVGGARGAGGKGLALMLMPP